MPPQLSATWHQVQQDRHLQDIPVLRAPPTLPQQVK